MDVEICLYSLCGEILTHCSVNGNKNKNIDLVQLHRFISSCFTFSKCDRIETCFDGLNIFAITRSMTYLVLMSKHEISSEIEMICHILLYCFEVAYETELKQMNDEQMEMAQKQLQSYTVHDIDKYNQEDIIIDEHSKFISFQYVIRKMIKTTNINAEIMELINSSKLCDFGIFLFDTGGSKIFEYCDHIIPNQIKQFVSHYDGSSKKLMFKAWNGIWNILSCDARLWRSAKLFLVSKYRDSNIDAAIDVLNNLKDYFESLVIGHNAETILTYIGKLKEEASIRPERPICNKDNNASSATSWRKGKYKKHIFEQQQIKINTPNSSEFEEELNILVIPSVPIDSIKTL